MDNETEQGFYHDDIYKRNYVCAGLSSLDRRSHLSINDCMFSMKDHLSWCCNSDTMRSHRHLTMTIKPKGRKLQNSLHKTGIAHNQWLSLRAAIL